MSKPSFLLGFVGDVMVDREHPAEAFEPVRELLSAPNILFGNLEASYSDDPAPAPSAGVQVIPAERNLDVHAAVGFDVMSMANNHIVDAGHRALLRMQRRLQKSGVATCGAGENLAAAREPAILAAGGLKVAYLAYASVFPFGYEARSNVPGLAPLRAYHRLREPMGNYHFPGTFPPIETIPDRDDRDHLADDIAQAKARADLVVVSCHWGDFLRRHHLTDHERDTARFCIDRGADMVVGHHHHMLRGMEWYAGKPILYGLGHFVFDLRLKISAELAAAAASLGTGPDRYPFPYTSAPDWPLLPMHPDARLTLLAFASVENGRVSDIGFVPCRLRQNGQVQAVALEEPEGEEVIAYIREACQSERLSARVVVDGRTRVGDHPAAQVIPG